MQTVSDSDKKTDGIGFEGVDDNIVNGSAPGIRFTTRNGSGYVMTWRYARLFF